MRSKIVFIHGMFLNPKSWDAWISHFRGLGYECEAPAWPYHVGEPSQLRSAISAELGSLDLATVYSYFQRRLRRKADFPILIGHSMGGLLVQKLVSEGLASAGVCLVSVAPNKMLGADWGFPRNCVSIANPLAGDDPYQLTEETFCRTFANTLSESEGHAAYQAYVVPESRQIMRDIMGSEATVDLDSPHVPLLFVGAEKDEFIPPSLVARNASDYADKRSHCEYVEFPNRSHFICGQPGWQDVADRVSHWLDATLHAVRA